MNYITCPKCHEENSAHNIHCSVCGARLDEALPSADTKPQVSTPFLKKIFAGLHLGKQAVKSTDTGERARPS